MDDDVGTVEERDGIRLALLVADVRLRDLAWSMIKPEDAGIRRQPASAKRRSLPS